jgi:D-arginine dehydrogenase
MSPCSTTVIIGGGIAGMAAAWAISSGSGDESLLVLEADSLTFAQSSARNAAIYRPLEQGLTTTLLATRSAALLRELSFGVPLIDGRGLVLAAADPDALAPLLRIAAEARVDHEVLAEAELYEACPLLRGGSANVGVRLPGGGILDTHSIGERLRKAALASGVRIRTRESVAGITSRRGVVTGVVLSSGERIVAKRVVLAAGAWSADLGKTCDAWLPLTPHRRHLAVLVAEGRAAATHPVAWDVDSGVYFRPEGTGYLACPGDHTPYPPGLPQTDPAQLERLAQRLPRFAPELEHAKLRRAWACLRTMAPDREAVVGQDPRVSGLFWLAGLGGFGMSAGLAAGQLLAKEIRGEADSLLSRLAPSRLLKPSPRTNQSVSSRNHSAI